MLGLELIEGMLDTDGISVGSFVVGGGDMIQSQVSTSQPGKEVSTPTSY